MIRLFKESKLLKKSELKKEEIINRSPKQKSIKTLFKLTTLEKENIKKLYKFNFSTLEISKLYRKSTETIAKVLFRYFNISKRKVGSKVEETFFDNIDSEIKAYLLGFFFADGCVCSDNSRFSLCNSIDDLETIKLFKEYICPESPINFNNNNKGALNRKQQCIFRWSSLNMKKSIENLYDLKPRKTYYDLKFPLIPVQFEKDFVRGYFDGDGCASLHYFSNGGVPYLDCNFIANNELFINSLCNIFDNNNIVYRKSTQLSKNNYKLHTLNIYGKNTVNLFHYLYKDSNFYLNRKYEKFLIYIDKGNTEINLKLKNLDHRNA